MVSKIIMYRFRSEAGGNYKETNLDWAVEKFAACSNVIPQLKLVETGINICPVDWSCDLAVIFELTSWSAVDTLLENDIVKHALDFAAGVSFEKRQIDYIF